MRSFRVYTITLLLLILLLVAGFFAGFRYGADQGRQEWMQLPIRTKEHNVKQIILANIEMGQDRGSQKRLSGGISEADIYPIIRDIQSHVRPETWKFNQNFSLRPDVSKLGIVISANDVIHAEIEEYLASRISTLTEKPIR